jgi:hypothetical protein
MSKEPVIFDSVSFWNMADECHLRLSGNRSICEISMVPLPGDRVSFEEIEQPFAVVYREFTFRNGICQVQVNVQPATRDNYPATPSPSA